MVPMPSPPVSIASDADREDVDSTSPFLQAALGLRSSQSSTQRELPLRFQSTATPSDSSSCSGSSSSGPSVAEHDFGFERVQRFFDDALDGVVEFGNEAFDWARESLFTNKPKTCHQCETNETGAWWDINCGPLRHWAGDGACSGTRGWRPPTFAEDDDARAERRRARKSDQPAQHSRMEQRLDELMLELFRVHDLDNDGLLGEAELIQLNVKIAVLHHGPDCDRQKVKEKFRDLFRTNLDADGRPVEFSSFRRYMLEVLGAYDPDARAQEMMLEQFIAEAKMGRAVFRSVSMASSADAQFLSNVSFREEL